MFSLSQGTSKDILKDWKTSFVQAGKKLHWLNVYQMSPGCMGLGLLTMLLVSLRDSRWQQEASSPWRWGNGPLLQYN